MIFFIISIILILVSLFFFVRAFNIKIIKDEEKQKYKNQLQQQIQNLQNNKKELNLEITKQKQGIKQQLSIFRKTEEQQIYNSLQKQKNVINESVQRFYKDAQNEITKVKQTVDSAKIQADKRKEQITNQLNKIKASLNAGLEAKRKQQEQKEKLNFYKLSINDADLSDIQMIENLKTSFHNPIVLNKLIWSQYFQKQTTELCNRVLGKQTICGIYKITDLVTEQCYIGQSVDIAQRWKDHIKCGLGIDASSSNKLYNSMQKDKIWNFTFELLETCSKDLLNEKQALWINMYSSNIYGLNTLKGVTNDKKF